MFQYFPYSLSHSFSLDPPHFALHFIREAMMHTEMSLAHPSQRCETTNRESRGVANLTQTISVICLHLFSVSGLYQSILLEQNLTHLVRSPE